MIIFNLDKDFWFTAEPKILAKAFKNHFFDSAEINQGEGRNCFYLYVNDRPYFDNEDLSWKDMAIMIINVKSNEGLLFGTLVSWLFDEEGCEVYFSIPTPEINRNLGLSELDISWVDASNKKTEALLSHIFYGFLYVIQNLQMRPQTVQKIKKYVTHNIPFEAKTTNTKVVIKQNLVATIVNDENLDINQDANIRSYTRHIESWEVLGHWRQYKSGKRIFIKPYIKGKGKVKDTNYQFETKGEALW